MARRLRYGTNRRGAARRVELLPEKDRRFELSCCTPHIDADHIGGVLPFLNEVKKGCGSATSGSMGGVTYPANPGEAR
jgi:hypothetical protein